MLSVLQQVILKAPPTSIDSLKHSLAQMQYKVDSLEKVVTKTEIGSGFFGAIIGLQLGVFLFLVSIAGWIGWRYFFRVLNSKTRSLEQKFTKMYNNQDALLTESHLGLTEYISDTAFDVNRAMYKLVATDKDHANAFDWAITSAVSLQTIRDEDENIDVWIQMSMDHLTLVEVGNQRLGEVLFKVIGHLDLLLSKKNESTISLIEEIRAKLYVLAYSPQQPPGDLMQGASYDPEQ